MDFHMSSSPSSNATGRGAFVLECCPRGHIKYIPLKTSKSVLTSYVTLQEMSSLEIANIGAETENRGCVEFEQAIPLIILKTVENVTQKEMTDLTK
ncbi:hypothetical protein C0J52_07660 [Blattella germanica]|nr:hypothetical protein C0J52_07660 [Blattella germanica]